MFIRNSTVLILGIISFIHHCIIFELHLQFTEKRQKSWQWHFTSSFCLIPLFCSLIIMSSHCSRQFASLQKTSFLVSRFPTYFSFRDWSTITHVQYILALYTARICSHKLSLLAILTTVPESYRTDRKWHILLKYMVVTTPFIINVHNSDDWAQQPT